MIWVRDLASLLGSENPPLLFGLGLANLSYLLYVRPSSKVVILISGVVELFVREVINLGMP